MEPTVLRGWRWPELFPPRTLVLLLAAIGFVSPAVAAPLLDAKEILGRETFWVNKDLDWFERNIPLIDTPDTDLNTTYYYRWELVTRHLIYGSPAAGYVVSEFANRPFWSGAYGTISCAAALQTNELRWLRDPRYARDYVRFWMKNPGAQPRNYSFPAADSAWAAHEVNPAPGLLTGLLPALAENYRQWEAGHWVEEAGLFWQLGHDDGMEFDINARQTQDILRGGQSLRPSFNAYLWADATAIAKIAALKGDQETREAFDAKAKRIKSQLQKLLWDPDRAFFFPMSNQEHRKDGFVVQKHTLTYQSGQYAGNPHGRELHGYVPWAFNLPDAGFEDAWRFLNDEEFFKAPFGPTTVERHDPLFLVNESCCWWSGQSWPFATTQTLKAMANLLQNYRQDHVSRRDYAELLHTFAVTQRKAGKPYVAEGANPFTGSWEGYDMENRSEHYFHSGFADLVITGLAGIQPAGGDSLVIHPLIPDDWPYFALDQVNYHGHLLSVVWDKTGERYRRGKGLSVYVDGLPAQTAPAPGRVAISLPDTRTIPVEDHPRLDYFVNNDGDYFPRYEASYTAEGSSLAALGDGNYVYDPHPANRWTTEGSPHEKDTVSVDFGTGRPIDTVRAYVLDDRDGRGPVRAPEKIELLVWDGEAWASAPPETKVSPPAPAGGRPFTITFPVVRTSRLRLVLTRAKEGPSGLTEIEAWGPGQPDYQPAPPPPGNIAYNPGDREYPRARASFSDVYGGVAPSAIDGKIVFTATPTNRWTSYGSPHKEDWLEIDFGVARTAGRAVLHIYDDRGGVQAPSDYRVEGWTGHEWRKLPGQVKSPERPVGNMANTVVFDPATVEKLRVVFVHHKEARSGVTEMEVWEK